MYFETWITTDQRKLPETIALHGNVFTQDNMANLIGVVLKNDGANVDIDGSVVGYAIRADKNTVIINGEKEGNRAWVILPEAAYAYPGPLSVVIRVVNGDDKTVIGAVSGYVTRSISGSPVDPGHVIPDITELLAMIEECEEAAGDANSAAALANTKAGLADTAATRANNAAAALEDMDATATTLTPGSSATATVSTVDGHYRVALGIPQGAKGDKGDTGDIGPTPAFSIGTVETLEPSEDATATITGTAAAPVLNLGIPKGEAGEVTEAELDAAIATAAPAIIASAGPAEIVSVTDGAEDAPVKKLVVNIEPVQDLHGYDSPWPAGGGKNLFDIDRWTDASSYPGSGAYSYHYSDLVQLEPNTTYAASAIGSAVSATTYLVVQTYTNGEEWNAAGSAIANIIQNGAPQSSKTFATGETGRVRYGYRVASSAEPSEELALIKATIKIQIEEGSAVTAWTPYSNICPITGWDSVKIFRRNQNLWNPDFYSPLAKITDQADAFYGFYGTNIRVWSDVYATKPGGMLGSSAAVGNLTVSADCGNVSETNSFTFRIFYLYADGTAGYNGNIRIDNNQDTRREYRDSVAGKICNGFNISCSSGISNTNGRIKDIMVSLDGSTVYVEPQSIDYNIPLPAEAGTVYGGTLTINSDGSGELVVDWQKSKMSDLRWSYSSSNNRFESQYMTSAAVATSGNLNVICSRYKAVTNRSGADVQNGEIAFNSTNANNPYLVVKDSQFTSKDEFVASLTDNDEIIYRLRTPTAYPLTAPQIRTLLGANNIWADAGPVSVEYTADTKAYIDSQTRATRSLIAGIETTMTASRAYAVGDLLIVGDTLYKAAASIASGATLTPGTNVTPTTVAEQLILLANA